MESLTRKRAGQAQVRRTPARSDGVFLGGMGLAAQERISKERDRECLVERLFESVAARGWAATDGPNASYSHRAPVKARSTTKTHKPTTAARASAGSWRTDANAPTHEENKT